LQIYIYNRKKLPRGIDYFNSRILTLITATHFYLI